MTEQQALAETLFMVKGLAWLAIILFVLMAAKEALMVSRLIRRYMGMNRTNGDPVDDVSLGQFRRRMDTHDEDLDVKLGVLKDSLIKHFQSIEKSIELASARDSKMLHILRDIRAFIIYGTKPSREKMEIEEESS